MDWHVLITYIYSSQLWRLESLKSVRSGSGESPLPGLQAAVVTSHGRMRERKLCSLTLLTRPLTPSWELHPEDRPKAPPPNIITGIKMSTYEFVYVGAWVTNVWSMTDPGSLTQTWTISRDGNTNGAPQVVPRDSTQHWE